ncbi:type II toxin-antitoxin system RelE/ParE family toxin [Candidatus Woesearchaeota archaeon]|nr:type II toxin-antitoxin system RelE/ParE family toxin [Candidatus Woesearchaeota archaeon]
MYNIRFEKRAADFFRKLEKPIQERIGKKIENLKTNPKLGVPLTGDLVGLWKLRIGDYRVIYQIKENELIIYVLKIGHRRNVYS